MRAGSSLRFLPANRPSLSGAIVLFVLCAALALLIAGALSGAGIGHSPPVDVRLLAPFRWDAPAVLA
jgi:hypothetical protein